METETKAATKKLTVRCQFCDTWNRIDASKVTAGPKCGKCGKPILLERPILLNDDTFTRTLNESDVPVAVDFYADWCGPCRMMAPAVDALAAHVQGRRSWASSTRTIPPGSREGLASAASPQPSYSITERRSLDNPAPFHWRGSNSSSQRRALLSDSLRR